MESSAYPNLGYTTAVDGILLAPDETVSIDTSTSTEYRITYRAEDPDGNIAVAERLVIVGDGVTAVDNTGEKLDLSPPLDVLGTSQGQTSLDLTAASSTDSLITDTTASSTPQTTEAQTASSSPAQAEISVTESTATSTTTVTEPTATATTDTTNQNGFNAGQTATSTTDTISGNTATTTEATATTTSP